MQSGACTWYMGSSAVSKPLAERIRIQNGPARASTAANKHSRTRASAVAPVQAPVRHVVDGVTDEKVGVEWDDAEATAYFQLHESQPIERTTKIPASSIKGTIPADLRGTLLRNGPGNFEFGAQRISHPFDGDGMVSAFSFDGGEVLMRRKFVRTKAMKDEMAAQRLLYKGAFTVGDPSGSILGPLDLSVRQPANTGVLDWAGRVLALYERDQPHVLSDDLDTAGRSNVGVWQRDDNMAAHYRITIEPDGSKRLTTFNAIERGADAAVKILELNEEGNKVHETELLLRGAAFGFFHDILVTDNYYVLPENPMSIDLGKLLTRYMFGQACIAECLYLDQSKPMKIHCIPRPGKRGRRRVYDSANKFAFHHINAWEAPQDTIVLDMCASDTIDFSATLDSDPLPMLRNPAAKTTPRRIVMRAGSSHAEDIDMGVKAYTELPAPLRPEDTGRPYSHFFATTGRRVPTPDTLHSFGQTVTKVELPPSLGVSEPFDAAAVKITEYYPGDYRYCGEPIFVPKAGASGRGVEDGYVLTLVADVRPGRARTTWLEILDATDIAAGPLAAIDVGDALPPGLHGSWTDRVLRAAEGEEVPWQNDIRVNFP